MTHHLAPMVGYHSCMNRLDLTWTQIFQLPYFLSSITLFYLVNSTSYANRQLVYDGAAPCHHVKPACSLKGYNMNVWRANGVPAPLILIAPAFLDTTHLLYLTITFNRHKANFSSCCWFRVGFVVFDPCLAALLYLNNQQQTWTYATHYQQSCQYYTRIPSWLTPREWIHEKTSGTIFKARCSG